MPKSGLTSKQEGYGWAHQQARAGLLAELNRNGSASCSRCPHPIYPGQPVDADHYRNTKPDPPDALAHASCNRRAGARRGNRLRGARLHGRPVMPASWGDGTPSRAW